MPRWTANIAFLFAELPFLDRIAAAKKAGFDQVECHFPYDVGIASLQEHLGAAGVRMTGLNTAAGDRSRGEFGFAGVPGQEDRFRRDFAQALDYAVALEASVIHVMAGVVRPEDRPQALRTYAQNLRAAARDAAGTGLTLVLEPLNTRDNPGYLVSRSDDIAAIIAEIGEPAVKLLFDVYHVQIMEGDLIRRLQRHRAHHRACAGRRRAGPGRAGRRQRGQLRRDPEGARRDRLRGPRRPRISAARAHGGRARLAARCSRVCAIGMVRSAS